MTDAPLYICPSCRAIVRNEPQRFALHIWHPRLSDEGEEQGDWVRKEAWRCGACADTTVPKDEPK